MNDVSTKCGVVAVIGAPNAGKSTLVNQLVGQKVAITSAKAQTTRARMLGIALHGQVQMILVDTPGIFAPRRRLDRAMVSAAWEGAESADAVLLIVDPIKQRRHELEPLLEALEKRPVSVEAIEAVINQIKHQLQATGEREVKSRAVGEYVMNALRDLDHVAYVRFASVYRDFQDLKEFREELDRLEKGGNAAK